MAANDCCLLGCGGVTTVVEVEILVLLPTTVTLAGGGAVEAGLG